MIKTTNRKGLTEKEVVIIGPGQTGQAIARRVGMGKQLLIADAHELMLGPLPACSAKQLGRGDRHRRHLFARCLRSARPPGQ
jgi:hypothetical protein